MNVATDGFCRQARR